MDEKRHGLHSVCSREQCFKALTKGLTMPHTHTHIERLLYTPNKYNSFFRVGKYILKSYDTQGMLKLIFRHIIPVVMPKMEHNSLHPYK